MEKKDPEEKRLSERDRENIKMIAIIGSFLVTILIILALDCLFF